MKKGVRRPLSNFAFKFLKKIIADDSKSTGYLVEVNPEQAVDADGSDFYDSDMECDDGSSRSV